MKITRREKCPTCHQTVNWRVVTLGKHHVAALLKVGMWLKKHHRTSAKMKEIKAMLTQVQYATFNEWKHLAPEIVSGPRGTYNVDLKALDELIKGAGVCIEYEVDPIANTVMGTKYGTIKDAKGVIELLDENDNYVAQYLGHRKL